MFIVSQQKQKKTKKCNVYHKQLQDWLRISAREFPWGSFIFYFFLFELSFQMASLLRWKAFTFPFALHNLL